MILQLVFTSQSGISCSSWHQQTFHKLFGFSHILQAKLPQREGEGKRKWELELKWKQEELGALANYSSLYMTIVGCFDEIVPTNKLLRED